MTQLSNTLSINTSPELSLSGSPAAAAVASANAITHESTVTPVAPGSSSGIPLASPAGILAERWPTLARALNRYEQSVAESFTRLAYNAIQGGIIPLDDRTRLAKHAKSLNIRDFDAQLLIACAVRKWSLDRAYDAVPSPTAPELSFEYQSWHRGWLRFTLLISTAVILDAIIIWRWLS